MNTYKQLHHEQIYILSTSQLYFLIQEIVKQKLATGGFKGHVHKTQNMARKLWTHDQTFTNILTKFSYNGYISVLLNNVLLYLTGRSIYRQCIRMLCLASESTTVLKVGLNASKLSL